MYFSYKITENAIKDNIILIIVIEIIHQLFIIYFFFNNSFLTSKYLNEEKIVKITPTSANKIPDIIILYSINATPTAKNVKLERLHDRNVRSLARWSLASEPVLSIISIT